MELSSINFTQNVLSKTNKLSNNKNATNISFQGTTDDKKLSPSNEHCTIYFHPVFELQKQLVEDGYSIEEIRDSHIFDITEIKDIDFSNPNLENDIAEGKITKNDIFSHSPKNLADIKAVQKAYTLLKQKFNSDDVQKHVAWARNIEEGLAKILEEKGYDSKKVSHYTTTESMILEVLRRVNKDNVGILRELLDDKNFNNIYLATALLRIDQDADMYYPHQTLQMAQEAGYDKKFSRPLAIMISEANETNMPIILKMLSEQEFLIENEDFVTSKMISFLRCMEPALAYAYVINDDITLKEIDRVM